MRKAAESFTFDFGNLSPDTYIVHTVTFTGDNLGIVLATGGWAASNIHGYIPETCIASIWVNADDQVTVRINNVDPVATATVGEITFMVVGQSEE